MADHKSDLGHPVKGTAILATCIVQTLKESDPSFEDRFLERMAQAYRVLRDDTDGEVGVELALLASTRTLLTGFDFVHGQGEPFPGGHA